MNPGATERERLICIGHCVTTARHRTKGKAVFAGLAIPMPRGSAGADLVRRLKFMVTERRPEPASDPQQRDLVEDLRAAVQSREAMLAEVGHTLRNSLAPLVLVMPMLEQIPDLDDFLRAKLGMLSRNIHGIRATLDRLCEVTSIREGRLNLRPTPIALDTLVREVCATHAIEVAGGSVTGRWDRARVEQIVKHLVANAVRHGAPPYAVSVRDAGDHAELVVGDAGPGLPPHARDRLAGRFETAGAFGVGCWIVHELTRAMGGTVRVLESERGACISVSLPRA